MRWCCLWQNDLLHSEERTKRLSTLCAQSAKFLDVKLDATYGGCSNQCTLTELNAVCFSSVISFGSDLYSSCPRGKTSSRNSAWGHAGGFNCRRRHKRNEISRYVVLYLPVAFIVVPTVAA